MQNITDSIPDASTVIFADILPKRYHRMSEGGGLRMPPE
jgi:hypothetical protein